MWKLKQKLNLRGHDPPMAKHDKNGQIIATKKGIIKLYEDEYKSRLAKRPPSKEYEELQIMKQKLFELRVKLGQKNQSEDWSIGDLEKVCQKLISNKARDRDGLVYELFKPKNCGRNILNSMLKMKSTLKVSHFMKKMSITSLYKGKGS